MGQALYRKYRSKNLTELVGQEHVTQTLANAIKAGRISHAYLFTGPKGVGKTSVARILAHEINKLSYSDGQHLDIVEIDAASNRRIDDIRELREKIHTVPVSAAYKVYIIDEVHMLTSESFNALLKTLEEPPAHVVFILATTEVHKLPATIVSRTQRFSFRPVEQAKVIAHLKHIAAQEKITITDDALALVAEHGEGSFRDSISLLDQLANTTDGEITVGGIEQSLGLAPQTLVVAIVKAVIAADSAALVTQLQSINEQGVTTASLLNQLLRALSMSAEKQPTLYRLIDQLLEVPRAYSPQLKLLTTLMRFVTGDIVATVPSATPSNTPTPSPTASTSPSTNTPHQTAAKKQVAAAAAAPPTMTVSKPVSRPYTTTASAPATTAEPTEASFTGSLLTALDAEGWAKVLVAIKQQSPPLHGIVYQAEPRFDAAAQKLTLVFRYQLHSKKMDDMKNKNILAKTMQHVLGGAPAIACDVDAEAIAAASLPPAIEAPAVETPSFVAAVAAAPADETTQSVIDLMGGGEVVNA